MMALVTLADNPMTLTQFCYRWNLANPITRPVAVRCSRCERQYALMFASDMEVSDHDAKVYLIFELFARGFEITDGKPICPECR